MPDDVNFPPKARIVVDVQIALSIFLTSRTLGDRPTAKRALLTLLAHRRFSWLWCADIITDYERGALAVESNKRVQKRASFDRAGFEIFLATLALTPPVSVSTATLGRARRRIRQATRSAERDLDDAIYLACAVDGNAQLITTDDNDLRSLGNEYEGVKILSWNQFRGYLNDLKIAGKILI